MGFPRGSVVKNLPAMHEPQETRVQSLGGEVPQEEDMATQPQRQRSLVGYSPWGRTESDTTEVTQHSTCLWMRKIWAEIAKEENRAKKRNGNVYN